MSARLRKGTDQDPSTDLENVNAAYQAMREDRDRAEAEVERLRGHADAMAAAILALRMHEGRAVWDQAEEARSAYLADTPKGGGR